MIPPEKIVALLNGSAGGPPNGYDGGTPGQLALTRREIARGLNVSENDELRRLLQSMCSAGYLVRERRGNANVYVLGRDLADGPTPDVPADQHEAERYRRDLEWLASRRPQGRRPGPRTGTPGRMVTGAPEPFNAEHEDVVHGANRPDKTLCFVPLAGMPAFDITRAAGTATFTRDLSIMTCAACLRVGDEQQVHGLLPGVAEFTACGEIVGDFHNPADIVVDASLRWPDFGATITCYPCREQIADFERDQERRAEAARKLAAGEVVHLGDPNRLRPVCPVTWPLPEGHLTTIFHPSVNCSNCIAINGGHTGYNQNGWQQGREAAQTGNVDTTRAPEHWYVQALAVTRAETFGRWLAAAEAEYAGRCTYAGAFNSEHDYEHNPAEVARHYADNDGTDEWERCKKLRVDVLHVGEPEADAAWLAELFEHEDCHECGRGAEGHTVTATAVGNRFAQCQQAAPRATSTGPDELLDIDHRTHTYLDGRDNMNALVSDQLGGQHDVANNEAYTAYQQGRTAYGQGQVDLDRYDTDRWYRVGVRDAHAATREHEWRETQQPTGWSPPAPRWTAKTFEGMPPEQVDDAEEAWRHRVERIDYWRQQGRLTDQQATTELTGWSATAVMLDEEVWRRNGTSGRFDPEYVDAVSALFEDAEGEDACNYCGQPNGTGHRVSTGPDGRPFMEHPPWDTEQGTGTVYPEQHPAAGAADELVPGDPVRVSSRRGIFEYVDDDGETALVTFEGDTEPTRVPKVQLRQHGQTR